MSQVTCLPMQEGLTRNGARTAGNWESYGLGSPSTAERLAHQHAWSFNYGAATLC